MRLLILFLATFLIASCSTAQYYSTKDKKAIKYFELAMDAPDANRTPANPRPNYKAGLEYLDKALDRDPKFWEAHGLAAEFNELSGNYEKAIEHYKSAISINPNHSRTGSTYFFLANLQHAVGDYDGAIKNLETFGQFKMANPDLLKQAAKIRENCVFAKNAMANPNAF